MAPPNNYQRLVQENLEKIFGSCDRDLAKALPAIRERDTYRFQAFGEACSLSPNGIQLGGRTAPPVLGILISLYARIANSAIAITEPLKAYSEFPNTMPYVGAFRINTETVLADSVGAIHDNRKTIQLRLQGTDAAAMAGGDFSMLLRPLPKISLCYIFYFADEDFPASIKCLFSNNADQFLPLDALADVGEYTSKKILQLLKVPADLNEKEP